jgi:type IV fimbrial biogenesis protein FimT
MLAMKRVPGFSLVELAVVLAIAAVVLALAMPDLREAMRAQQIRTGVHDLFDAINLARAEAMTRNERVELIPRDSGGVDWTRGWTVFVDRDGDRQPGAGDDIIAVHGPLAAGMAADFSFTSPAPPYYIAYNGAGRSCSAASSAQARWGTLSLFHGRQLRRIKINMLGRARVCDPARDSSCDGAAAPP